MIWVSISFAFNSSIYIGVCVMEKERHLKYAIRAMGGSTFIYWISNLTFDMLLYALL
jgi:hypothetical protein